MKILNLILVSFFMTACNHIEPGTYDGPGTTITGKVVDSITMKPLGGVSIDNTLSTNNNGNFYIPSYTLRNIIAFGDGPWGSHRTFMVSKEGYIPMLCVSDMRLTSAYALIRLVPKGTKVQSTLIDAGENVICEYTARENSKDKS